MDLSLFLAKLFGLYFLIIGIIFLFRRKSLISALSGFAMSRALLVIIALLEIIAGLAMVISHSIFTVDYRIIISIIGYWLVIEGVIYLVLSPKAMKKFISMFNKPGFYVSGGIISILMGLYLGCVGFNLWM